MDKPNYEVPEPIRPPEPSDGFDDNQSPNYESENPFQVDQLHQTIRPRGLGANTPTTFGMAHFRLKNVLTVTAGSVLPINAKYIPVVGSGGPIVLTSTLNIAAGLTGQEIVIEGTDNTNTVSFTNGNGVKFAGGTPPVLGLHDTVTLFYNSAFWLETARSNNT